MSDLSDVTPENDSGEPEIESPFDGPMPDWMKVAASSSGGSSLDEDEVPDWLQSIRAGQGEPSAGGEEAPPGPKASAVETPAADDGMSDLERLLAEEGIDLGTVAEERPEGAEAMSARDWLISTSDDELVRKRLDTEPVEEAPAPPPAPEPEPEAPPPAPVPEPVATVDEVVEEELPDWLQDVSADETLPAKRPPSVPPPTPEPVSPVPEPVATIDDDDKMVVAEDLPDWLQETGEEKTPLAETLPPVPAPMPAPVATAGEQFVEEELPDWLQEMSDDETFPEEPRPVSAFEPAPPTPALEEEDLPDWLQDDEAEAPLAEAPVSESVATVSDEDKMIIQEDLPDWLQDVTEDETAPAVEEPITDTLPIDADRSIMAEDLPDWLQEVGTEDEEELPGWLRADVEAGRAEDETFVSEPETVVSGAETGDEESLPDWLDDMEEEAPAAPAPKSVTHAAVEVPATGELEEEELPDWLREVQAEEPSDLELAAEVEAAAAFPDASEEVDEEDLPDWLKEVQEEEEVVAPTFDLETVTGAALADVGAVSDEDLPDWLREVQIGESEPFEPVEPILESFGDFRDEEDVFMEEPLAGVDEEEELIEAELPDWLQEETPEPVVKAETFIAPTPEPPSVRPATLEEGLIDEEGLPDWLQEFEEEAEPWVTAEARASEVGPTPQLEPPAKEKEVEVEKEEVAPAPVPSAEVPVPKVKDIPAVGMPNWLKKLREGEAEEEEVKARIRPRPQPVAKVAAPVEGVVESEPEDGLSTDPEERLELARLARDKGEIEEAVRTYDSLVSRGIYLDRIIEDLEQTIKSYPSNYMLFQLMGDAMMKDGRLQSALEVYRQALSKL